MDSIHDALLQTSAGRKIIVEAKNHKLETARRFQDVIDLIKAGFPGRPDILAQARDIPFTGDVIRAGGPPYNGLVTALKYASTDRRTALAQLGLLKN